MPTFAVLDVGTQSVKLHVASRNELGAWSVLADRSEITRLGEGLSPDGGVLLPLAMTRTADAVAGLVDEARRQGAQAIAMAGTMGLRIAANREAFRDEVRRRTGLELEVLSGAEECRLAYLAVRQTGASPDGAVTVFDTGGGSSQFTFGRGTAVLEQFSVNVGALRIMESHGLAGPVPADGIRRVLAALAEEYRRLDGAPSPTAAVGVGGAITSLASVMHGLAVYDPAVIRGSVLSRAEIDRQIELYRTRTVEDRRRIPGLQPRRADVILAGACMIRAILERLRADTVQVSDRGLRHGLLLDRFGNA